MSKCHRYSKKQLQTMADNINNYTKHKVSLFFGCGCYVEVDGKEYNHYRKKYKDYEGLKNKEVAELLRQFDSEITEEYKRRDLIGKNDL